MRILILEPDDATARLYQSEFAKRGWLADRVPAYTQAAELIAAGEYHVAIIELMLPDALGTEAWWQLKEQRPALHAIFTTVSPSLHRSVNVMGRGVLAYWLKPLDLGTLCHSITVATNNCT